MNLHRDFNPALIGLAVAVALALACSTAAQAQTAAPPAPTAVLIENVRIFDGQSDKLSAPSNVQVLGNKISTISTAPIATDRTLKLVTHDNAQLLALSGPRNPYPGKLGVVEVDALADLLLVDGDPIANLELVANPDKNFLLIMKDGQIVKNQVR